jgi:hypothetical protein
MSEWLRKIGGEKRKERGRRKMYEGRKTWSERGRRENQEINFIKENWGEKILCMEKFKKNICVCAIKGKNLEWERKRGETFWER